MPTDKGQTIIKKVANTGQCKQYRSNNTGQCKARIQKEFEC